MGLPLLAQTSPYVLILGIDVLDRRDLCDIAAFHHGAGRHAFVRPRRLFRAGRLWRGAAGKMARRADGAGAARRTLGGARRCASVRLVRGAAVRRLSRHADAGLRADRLGRRVPVGRLHRRLQRRDRRLAAAAVRQGMGVLRPDAVAGDCRRAAAAAIPVRAVRLRHAGRARFPAARRSHRHRRQARALARLRRCRLRVRRRRRAVRLRQGLDLAGDHQRRPLHRRPGDGAARRHPDADRPDPRRLVSTRCCRTR